VTTEHGNPLTEEAANLFQEVNIAPGELVALQVSDFLNKSNGPLGMKIASARLAHHNKRRMYKA
jgi:hypothetical protein